jgi:hypothetical protein
MSRHMPSFPSHTSRKYNIASVPLDPIGNKLHSTPRTEPHDKAKDIDLHTHIHTPKSHSTHRQSQGIRGKTSIELKLDYKKGAGAVPTVFSDKTNT